MLSRRRFLKSGASLAAAAGTLPFWARSTRLLGAEGAPVLKASQLVAGKDDALFVHTADPFVFEAPLELLARERITSKSRLFVRNNSNPAGAATTAAAPAEWTVEFVGLAQGAKALPLADLADLPKTEVEMVLQCSGNGRSQFSKAAKTSGTQWGRGGVGNVVFGGVKLADVLKFLKAEPAASARYVAAEGKDVPRPKEDDFEHSIPLADALEGSFLALTMNGEPLPAVHGGPVRLVTPGYYGTVQLKWLSKLRFEEEESANSHHAVRYRTPKRRLKPGDKFTFDRSNSVPTWKIKIASLVTSPADGAELPAGKVRIAGYAWNDGAAAIRELRVSTDQGESWRRVALEAGKSPYAWTPFDFELDFAPGRRSVWVAAVDELGRTQPLDGQIAWNPAGYEWNGVEKLTFDVK